jgi:hypothetical protein
MISHGLELTHPRYMSESQAFFLLSVLCDRLLPGYYSTTMYGTLLDQKVFESLVEKTMPVLWEHLVKSDVQLSVVSLPWFLSLYINSMPLVFAFRVLDVFFLEGPKVLFQVGLAILRINGEELLDVQDDGSFISILKSYFSRLDESAHPRSENPKLRAITRFQELMVVAFKEFSGITHNEITEHRAKHKDAVLENIENFAKRTSIRNLGPESKKLSMEDLGAIYDRFYEVLYDREQRQKLLSDEQKKLEKKKVERYSVLGPPVDAEVGRVGLGPSPTHMDYDAFREFLAETARWAIADSPGQSRKQSMSDRNMSNNGSMRGRSASTSKWGEKIEPADHEFMERLYRKWNTDGAESLSLQNVAVGLAKLKGTRDIMNSINYFFDLYDDSGNGQVDREGILRISEALLFLSRRGFDGAITPSETDDGLDASLPLEQRDRVKLSVDERFLGSVSSFIRRCFEYADPSHPQNQSQSTSTANEEDVGSATTKLDAFEIGDDDDDEDEDLIEVNEEKEETETEKGSSPSTPLHKSTRDSVASHSSRPEAANAALDPNNPLHITLPTFRMVVLADELLEQFFETFFPQSFRLSDRPHPASLAPSSSLSSNLTTFSNLGAARSTFSSISGATAAGASGGIVPPTRGLRGVLDNIVSDGMRMATEVRKRMEEAQREMERNALNRGDEEEEEDDDDGRSLASSSAMVGGISSWGAGAYGIDSEQRGVRDRDRDLLEGAEAESVPDDKDTHQPSSQPSESTEQPSSSASSAPKQLGEGNVAKVEFDS